MPDKKVNEKRRDKLQALRQEILEKREGTVYFEVGEVANPSQPQAIDLLDAYVERSGFQRIGSTWREIDPASARKIITRILHKELAYDYEVMPLHDAQVLADSVIGTLTPSARFFTNGTYAEEEESKEVTWHSITKATFDTGVAFIDALLIGLLWIEDED